jgi:photosystem II stability/assembly factor-like uncharacterized protein
MWTNVVEGDGSMTLVRTASRALASVAALALSAAALAVPSTAGVAATRGTEGTHALARHLVHWRDAGTGVDEEYRGLDAVNRRVAWVSGEKGGVLRTTDGGRNWRDVAPRGTRGMAFRDVEARDARHASVLAIGTGTASRIYTTDDGGSSWTVAFVNHNKDAFYDCIAFWRGHRNGIGMSDPVGGRFRIIRTHDSGHTWHVVSDRGMPPAMNGEFGFAASGTCIVTAGRSTAYLASGGSAARVFRTRDRGRTWQVTDSRIPPVPNAGGVFSLAFKGPRVGIAVGGDFLKPKRPAVSSRTTRFGRVFVARGRTLGYRSGVAWVSPRLPLAVAVGPTGTDGTPDAGAHWYHLDDTPFDSVQCTADWSCWASGPHGAVARVTFG